MRRRVFILVLIALTVACIAYWQFGVDRWSGEVIRQEILADGVELTICEFEYPDTDRVTVLAVKAHHQNAKFMIDFSDPDPAILRPDFTATGRAHQAVAMINGGYFDASFKPVGLVVKDGQTVSTMSQQPPLSGVLAVFDNNELLLIPRSSYQPSDLIQSAIQAGPFIVDPGGGMGIHSDDLKKAKRTAVGQTVSGEIVFITTSPCTLYELSHILTEHNEVLGVTGFDRILNLDGGPSTGLYLQGLEEHHSLPETEVPNRILMLNR